jgi:hypothetical protein
MSVTNKWVAKKSKSLQVDSAKPRPPYTGAKYRVGRALAPARSRSRGAGARFAFDPIRHPQSEPPEMGFAFASAGSGVVVAAAAAAPISSGFSSISTSEAELVTDVAPGVGARLGPGTRLASECRRDHTSLIRLSSKSRQSGMMPSKLSDQTTSTRSSRFCWERAQHEFLCPGTDQ